MIPNFPVPPKYLAPELHVAWAEIVAAAQEALTPLERERDRLYASFSLEAIQRKTMLRNQMRDIKIGARTALNDIVTGYKLAEGERAKFPVIWSCDVIAWTEHEHDPRTHLGQEAQDVKAPDYDTACRDIAVYADVPALAAELISRRRAFSRAGSRLAYNMPGIRHRNLPDGVLLHAEIKISRDWLAE